MKLIKPILSQHGEKEISKSYQIVEYDRIEVENPNFLANFLRLFTKSIL